MSTTKTNRASLTTQQYDSFSEAANVMGAIFHKNLVKSLQEFLNADDKALKGASLDKSQIMDFFSVLQCIDMDMAFVAKNPTLGQGKNFGVDQVTGGKKLLGGEVRVSIGGSWSF